MRFLRSFAFSLVTSLVAADKYIVVLRPGLEGTLGSVVDGVLGNTVPSLLKFTLGSFSGFNADLSDTQVALLKANPSVGSNLTAQDSAKLTARGLPGFAKHVAYVEKDGKLRTWGAVHPDAMSEIQVKQNAEVRDKLLKRATTTQNPSTWGLGRISHQAKGISTYVFDSSAGSGSCIYVIDSGVYTGHNEFGGRATNVANYVSYESSDDYSGHGTSVAAVAAGASMGVARNAKVYSIKVCDRSGACDVSSTVNAISQAVQHSQTQSCPAGVVINLSLGGPSAGWQSVRDAVAAATQNGAFVVAAAGNDHANANNYLPASAPGACSVGATDYNDAIWSSSNYGTSMAVFAPGVGIQSAGLGSSSATSTNDGTSVSASFVSGLGAYFWAKDGKGTSSNPGVALCAKIKSLANKNKVTGSLGGSPNNLAYNTAA